MKAQYDGQTVTLTMTRAEAHVAIWGGKPEILGAVESNIRHALVAAEDRISEDEYREVTREVVTLNPTLIALEEA